jgi:clan AA aspartic protease
MLTGRVNTSLQPWVAIEVMGADGQFRSIEFVLDTGFNGTLTLPLDAIRRLGLPPDGPREVFLANGDAVTLNGWGGTVIWQGRRSSILVLQADGEPLLGMRLLHGHRVSLDVLEGGDVTIDEIPLVG